MGIQCSRQGYIQDFHEFEDGTRLAPEGQCYPSELLLNRNAVEIKVHTSAVLQNSILSDRNLAKRILPASLCLKSCQQWKKSDKHTTKATTAAITTACFTKENFNSGCHGDDRHRFDLPPEGKVTDDKIFVELPKANGCDKMKHCLDPQIVQLSREKLDQCTSSDSDKEDTWRSCESAVSNRDDQSTRRSKEGNQSTTTSSTCDEDESSCNQRTKSRVLRKKHCDAGATRRPSKENEDWMYTLYDLEGNQLLTRQAVNLLMDSIRAEARSSSLHSKHMDWRNEASCAREEHDIKSSKSSMRNNMANDNTRLEEIDQVRHPQKSVDVDETTKGLTSPSKKYSPCKAYNGIVFPPSTTEEAEKLNNYIEQKLHAHRKNLRQKRDRANSRSEEESRSPVICSKCRSNRRFNKEENQSRRKGNGEHIGKRSREITCPLVHRSHSYNSEHDNTTTAEIHHHQRGSRTFWSDSILPTSSESAGTNTPHSCDEVFHKNSVNKKQLNHRHQKRRASEEGSNDILRFRHCCSCHQRTTAPTRCGDMYEGHDRQRHVEKYGSEWWCHRKDELYQREQKPRTWSNTKSSPKVCSSRGELTSDSCDSMTNYNNNNNTKKQLYSKDRTTHRKTSSQRVCTEQTPQPPPKSMAQRPDVWPGCSSSMRDVHAATAETTITPATKVQHTVVTNPVENNVVFEPEQLCFCKRMLGTAYPCNHGPYTSNRTKSKKTHSTHTVRYKHEHHHYHYHVPHDLSSHVT